MLNEMQYLHRGVEAVELVVEEDRVVEVAVAHPVAEARGQRAAPVLVERLRGAVLQQHHQ